MGTWDTSDTLEAVGTAALITAAVLGSPVALGALAVAGTVVAAVDTTEAVSGLMDSANNYGNALNNEVNASPNDLPQAEQNAQAATTPMLQDAVNTALTVPGTSFTGPVDVPEFNGEKPTGQDIRGAINDAALDQVKDIVKDKAKDWAAPDEDSQNNKKACHH